MKNSAPLLLALFGFVLLVLVMPEGFVLSMMAATLGRHPEEIKGQAASLSLGMAIVGTLCMVLGIARFSIVRGHERTWGPYTDALSRLAMEHGQGVFPQKGGGIGFQSAREGRQLEVQAVPGNPPMLIIRQAVVARQALLFVKTDADLPASHAHFKPAGEGRSWELLAELPALAKAHMNDLGVVQRMDRFFELRESQYITHDAGGIEIVCELPIPTLVGQRAREALDVVAYLRQVNG